MSNASNTTALPAAALESPAPSAPLAGANRAPVVSPRWNLKPGGLPPHPLGQLPGHLFAAVLDQIEHAILVLDGMTVLHANRAALYTLAATNANEHPLTVRTLGSQRQLTARRKSDAAALESAVFAAAGKGLRKLLMLGVRDQRTSLVVMPLGKLAHADPVGPSSTDAVLVMLGKRRLASELPIGWYARNFGLTQSETNVLQALCRGKTPNEIAADHCVAISTVRTQLAAIRAKTQTQSLRELVDEVACLPPLVHALTGVVMHH